MAEHVPASIRYKNPGAMWGRVGRRLPGGPTQPTDAAIPLKWGSTETQYLSDGLGQGNNIAIFPTYLDGICAQMEMWMTKPAYRNQRLIDAISTWSGHNNVGSYIHYLEQHVPGITEDTVMDAKFWSGPMAVPFLKAQAGHEAGQPYPAPDSDFIEAQRRVLSKQGRSTKTVAATTAAAAAAATAQQAGLPGWAVALIAVGVAAAILFFWGRSRQ